MFKNLSKKISQAIHTLVYRKRMTEKDIQETLNTVRISLLEADVALPVVQTFINKVQCNMIGKNINTYLTPGQEFIKIMHAALIKTMQSGCSDDNLILNVQNPTIILIVGLQGVGKTTTVGKLANFLKIKKNKKVLVVSVDTLRPAGIAQLKILIHSQNINFFSNYVSDNAIDIAKESIIHARLKCYDVVLIDTAGCSDMDINALSELHRIYNVVNPIETLLVVDSMTGQIAINVVNFFNKSIPLTGFILTKLDGDVRGGVALSLKFITGKSIKFMGIGETIDSLEVFHPNRIVNQIFGMGDILSLIEKIDQKPLFLNKKKNIFSKKNDFNLCDFLDYINQVQSMGGIDQIISKLPNLGLIQNNISLNICNNDFLKMKVIINSMTIQERMNPDIINLSRKKRIAIGSGVCVKDVTKLLVNFNLVQNTMKKIDKSMVFKMIRMLRN